MQRPQNPFILFPLRNGLCIIPFPTPVITLYPFANWAISCFMMVIRAELTASKICC
jgi:hypothetical protein